MNYVDVALDYAAARTDYAEIDEPSFAFDGGVAVALGAWRPWETDLGFLTGLHLSSRAEDTLHLATWELPLEAQWRFPAKHGFARLHFEFGGGPHLLLLLVSYTEPFVDVSLATHMGVGLTLGTGDVRGVLGVRGTVALGPDEIDGTVTTADGVRFWSWTASTARADVYAGVSFR